MRKIPNDCWCQLLKHKLNIDGRTIDDQKQAILRCHLGLWKAFINKENIKIREWDTFKKKMYPSVLLVFYFKTENKRVCFQFTLYIMYLSLTSKI